MLSLSHQLQLEVSCPACLESDFASLASPEAIAGLQAALRPFEGDARRRGNSAVWVQRRTTPETPPDSPRLKKTAVASAAEALELARWENEGGAPAATS